MGLLGVSASGAGADVCAAHGRMTRAIAEVRASGTPEATARAALITPQTPPSMRGLLDSTITLVYARAQPPAVVAAQAEALCRQSFPAAAP